MAKSSPLTKKDLIEVLKKYPTKNDVKEIVKTQTSGFATKNDVKEIVKQGVMSFATKKDVEDIVFNELSEFHANITKPELDKLNTKIDDVSLNISFIKDDIRGITADLSTTVSKREFNDLKRKMSPLQE